MGAERTPLRLVAPCLLAASLIASPAFAQLPRFLSVPKSGAQRTIARDHLRMHRSELGLTRADLESAREHIYKTRRSGTTHLHLRQQVRGIDVQGGDLGMAVDRRGRVFARWSRFTPEAGRRTNAVAPALSASQALSHAADRLGLPPPGGPTALRHKAGPARHVVYPGGAVSRDEIPVHLIYVPRQGELHLAWSLVIRTPDGRHWWQIAIDAFTGEELSRADWIAHETYHVYPFPRESPDEGPRTFELMPADALASPFGWHDTNGLAGAEFSDTRGNNVSAQEDVNSNDLGGFRPDGGVELDFDFPIDLSAAPSSYQSASIANLFYWTNIAHDLFYQYGFDEASGNFQANNYLRGGVAGDAVQADAQDGGSTNNAQFGTPPEGTQPRLEMYLFTGLGAHIDVTTPASIAGVRRAGVAQFGPPLDVAGISGNLAQALDPSDGAGPSTHDACSALTNPGAVAGHIALADRGGCTFVTKVKNLQDAGALAAVVVNDTGDDVVTMTGSDPSIAIASVFIGQSDGSDIEAELAAGVSASLQALMDRDASLDNASVIHEYGHGVTNRLTGGAASVFCLQASQSRSMGEGWSDFFQLAFTAEAGDASTDPKYVGTYSLGEPDGPGFRSRPYTTDLAANELTLASAATHSIPHGVGEVWAIALWDTYWELVQAYGFDPDLYRGEGGNNLAIQLVVDGLKLQACSPTFLEARDAVLDAELNETGGSNACYLWRAFAKRGMGPSATISADAALLTGISEDFSLPAECSEFCGDGSLQSGEECDDANRIDYDGCTFSCEIEFEQPFVGIAAGGDVTLVVEGQLLVVPTTAGQTAAQVAAATAAAINTNPTLMGMGVGASGVGNVLITPGSLDSVAINDLGLAPSVPLGPAVAPLLGLGLLGLGIRSLRARARSRSDRARSRE